MIEAIAEIGGALSTGGLSSVLGGAFGAISGWLQKRQEIQVIELQLEDKKLSRHHELNLIKWEAEAASDLAKVEAEGQLAIENTKKEKEIETKELQNLMKSYSHDKRSYSEALELEGGMGKFSKLLLVLIDFYRGIVRPTITCASVIFLAYIFMKFAPYLDDMSQEQNYRMLVIVVNTAMFLTTTSVGWWFGSRGKIYNIDKKP